MAEIKLKIASVVIGSGEGGGSGVAPYYADLPDKPSINGETLSGDMSSEDLGLASAGQSVPSGGTTGQVLAKKSNADNDVQWVNRESGGQGTTNYADLDNKPQINSVALSGNKRASDLGLATAAQGVKADSALQPKQSGQYTNGNMVMFDNNGGLVDSGKRAIDFITKSVSDLTNYYLKSETYTKAEVAALIGAIQQFHYEIYATLPASGESNVLYLIGPTGSGSDRYEEYVYSNNAFTKIGDTSIDLSGYVTTTALNTALADYTTTSNLTALLSNKADKVSNATNGNFAGLDANGNLTDSGKKASDFATASQGAKADTAIQTITVGTTTTGAAGTDASVTNSGTATNPVLDFTIPRGANGQDGEDAYNPFKGTYLITDTLPTTVQAGDYIYVVDTQTPPVTHLYAWNGTAFVDSGETVTMGNSQFANSTKPISQTNVVNDLTTGGAKDVLSAEQGTKLNREKLDKQNDDDTFYIVDSQDRIIAKIDASGVHSVDYTYKNAGDDDADEDGNVSLKTKINTLLTLLDNETSAREGLAETVNAQLAEKLDVELDGNTFYFTDPNGYTICKIDADGIHAPNIGGGGGASKEAVACMVIGESYLPTSITRDSIFGFVTTMNVIFQTGVTGSLTFTYDNIDGISKGNITSIAVVYGTSNYTITISRDADGNTTSASVA